jgi:hypothetical protein
MWNNELTIKLRAMPPDIVLSRIPFTPARMIDFRNFSFHQAYES